MPNAVLSAGATDGQGAAIEWSQFVANDDSSMLDPYNVQGFTWFDGEKAHRESFGDVEGEGQELGDVRWVSLADKYFMAALLSKDATHPARIVKKRSSVFGPCFG